MRIQGKLKKLFKKYFLGSLILGFLSVKAQQPTVHLTVDQSEISEAGGKAVVTARLSHVSDRDVTIVFRAKGMAKYNRDFTADFTGKGASKIILGAVSNSEYKIENLWTPTSVVADNLGNLYVCDQLLSRIFKLNLATDVVEVVAGNHFSGEGADQLALPADIVLDKEGNLYIADMANHRIQKWAPGAIEGITVAGGNGLGSLPNQLNFPSGISFDHEGYLYITDSNNYRVQKWKIGESEGITVVDEFEDYARPYSHFNIPRLNKLFVDKFKNIFISTRYQVAKWSEKEKRLIYLLGRVNQVDRNAPVDNPNHVYIDEEGVLYVAESGANAIFKVYPGSTQRVLVAGGNGGGNGLNQLDGPKGFCFDNKGDFFIADSYNSRILKLNIQPQIVIPAGQLTGTFSLTTVDDLNFEDNEWIEFDIEEVENASLLSNQEPIQLKILDNDGPPKVQLTFAEPQLHESGDSIAVKVQLIPRPEKNVSFSLRFSGTAILGTDYTVDQKSLHFAPNDTIQWVFIKPINDQLIEGPESIIVDVQETDRISAPFPIATINLLSEDQPKVSISLSASSILEKGGNAKLTATLNSPHSHDVTLIISNKGSANIEEDYQLNFSGKGGTYIVAGGNGLGNAPNQLYEPQEILVDHEGTIWIADRGNQRIQKWAKHASSGETYQRLDYTAYLAFDKSRNIYAGDIYNNSIKKIAPDGTQVTVVAGNNGDGNAMNQLYRPHGFSVDSDGAIFIADRSNNRIQKWTAGSSTGSTVVNSSGSWYDSTFFDPTDVFVDSKGSVFYTDSQNARIFKWNPATGKSSIVAQKPQYVYSETLLKSTSNLHVDESENIYIVDSWGNQITKWAVGTPYGKVVAGGKGAGSALNQLNNPKGVFLDQYGNLYISDTDNHRVVKVIQQAQIIIPAGQTTGTLEIVVINDYLKEPTENIIFTILDVDNATSAFPRDTVLTLNIENYASKLEKQTTIPIPSLSNAALSWGDFDQDGDQDLVILGYNNDEGAVTRVYRNDQGNLVNANFPFTLFLSGDIKWTDVNKDGFLDILVSGLAAIDDERTEPKTLLYINQQGKSFTLAPNSGIEHLFSSKIAFGDLDNDGDIDLAFMGNNAAGRGVLQIYKNEGGSTYFTRVENFEKPVAGTENDRDLKIADFDLDGDNDILYNAPRREDQIRSDGYIRNNFESGGNFSYTKNLKGLRYEVTKLLNNQTNLLTIFAIGHDGPTVPKIEINDDLASFNPGMPTLKDGDIAVGDYNNDGLNDILFTGRNGVNIPVAKLYAQSKSHLDRYGIYHFLEDFNQEISGLYNATADWVDYDVDGDLDLIMTGLDANNIQQTYFYKNTTSLIKNRPPAAPSNLRVVEKGNGLVEFQWDKPKDDISNFFGYNIRIGTTPGGSELSNTLSNLSTGSRLITSTPPLFKESYATQLSPGRYYWSVQAIDQGYQGSPFAEENILDLTYEWKLNRQVDIINRSIEPYPNPKFLLMDFDNDQDLDLVYGSSSSVRLYKFDKNEFSLDPKSSTWGGVENMVAGDLNNDGRVDLVINHTNKYLCIYLNSGSDFYRYTLLTTNGLVNTKLKIVDMNNNGRKEVMLAGMTSSLSDGIPKLYSFEVSPSGYSFITRDESSKIASLRNAVYDFGDFDKDGLVDFVLSGSGNLGVRTLLYRNTTIPGEPLRFHQTNHDLPRITRGTVNFIDFDADGDEDLLFTGRSTVGNLFQIYSNEFKQGNGFVPKPTNLDPMEDARVRFGDFNGDGYTDIFYSGLKEGTGKITRLAQFNPSNQNYENSTFDYGNLTDAEVAFGDIDSDGDLDIILGGIDVINPTQNIFRALFNVRNESAVVEALDQVSLQPALASNSPKVSPSASVMSSSIFQINVGPTAPSPKSLSTVSENSVKLLRFEWNSAKDDHTPISGLTYSLRIGTTPNNEVILAANSNESGVLKVPSIGNVSINTSWSIRMLPDGIYYWSVQAIDAAFIGSPFSTPQKFTIRNGEVLTVPSQPGEISGETFVACPGVTIIYTIDFVDQATSYEWRFLESNPQATITSTGSNSATVSFQSGFTGATLMVLAKNEYGDSPIQSKEIIRGQSVGQPGIISASQVVVCQNSNRSYSILPVEGATSYEWAYTGSDVTFSGASTSIQVKYGSKATNGEWRVRALNACGPSEARTLTIEVIPQNLVIPGSLVIEPSVRKVEKATQSITLAPSNAKPILIESGSVFSAQIVGCPVGQP